MMAKLYGKNEYGKIMEMYGTSAKKDFVPIWKPVSTVLGMAQTCVRQEFIHHHKCLLCLLKTMYTVL